LKTLALEDIYDDPHKLDSFLASGEPVAVVHDGHSIAEFVSRKDGLKIATERSRPSTDFRARFLKMWGADAFKNKVSVAEQFEELRRPREL
jgi:hypothetical protein